jgi:hypothetical protein
MFHKTKTQVKRNSNRPTSRVKNLSRKIKYLTYTTHHSTMLTHCNPLIQEITQHPPPARQQRPHNKLGRAVDGRGGASSHITSYLFDVIVFATIIYLCSKFSFKKKNKKKT